MTSVIITTPRGKNVGQNVLQHLQQDKFYKFIEVKMVESTRNVLNKTVETVVQYTYRPKA